jgi:hypothetical protein
MTDPIDDWFADTVFGARRLARAVFAALGAISYALGYVLGYWVSKARPR